MTLLLPTAPAGLPRPLAGVRRCLVMAVLNVTPDSFSDGGRWLDEDAAVAHGLALLTDGADLVDVGGESTRPGAGRVPAEEEQRRVLPVIRRLSQAGAVVCVDTMRAGTARAALDAGAALVNDVSGGLADAAMADVVARADAPYVVMHWRGPSDRMDQLARYDDVVADGARRAGARVDALVAAGVARERLVLDPGIGFAKDAGHNWRCWPGWTRCASWACRCSWARPASASSAACWPGSGQPRPGARRAARGRHDGGDRAGRRSRCLVRTRAQRPGQRRRRTRRRGTAGGDPMSDAASVEAANTSFYAAVESADLDLLGAIWADGSSAGHSMCVHPGWPALRGRDEILRSFSLILANTPYIQFFLTDVEVRVAGDVAVVTCAENILTGVGGDASSPLPGAGSSRPTSSGVRPAAGGCGSTTRRPS
jgi:dihydropteroate synthase